MVMEIRPRLLVTRRLLAQVEESLTDRFDATFNSDDRPLAPETLHRAVADYDAIFPTLTDRIDERVLGSPSARVRILASYGAGTDHIDLAAAKRAGIVVTNTPDALTDATADLAILLMLMASRRAGEGERLLRAGGWCGWTPTGLLGRSIGGRTLGLVGFGRIARAVAARATQGFGMRIRYFSRSRAPAEVEASLGATRCDTLAELAAEADVLSLHCPGGAATRHLVDARLIAVMKPTAVLVNTARGSVVDEAALASALAERRISAAGLDVYAEEPRVHPALLTLENVVLLPHLGSATVETRAAMGLRVLANLDAFFAGREPPDRVA